jgi:cell wall-associated NlpC family hydrolase
VTGLGAQGMSAGETTLEGEAEDFTTDSGGGTTFLPQLDETGFRALREFGPKLAPLEPPDAPSTVAKGVRKSIVDEASKYLGVNYVWGGTSRTGVDCSGLVQSVFASMGVELPRVSFQQARAGAQIGRKQAQPGDLVAWDNSPRNNGADHIAIYLGDGKILEAPRTGLKVRIRSLDADEDVWFVDMGDKLGRS